MLNPLRGWMRASPTQQRTRAPARADDLAELTVKDLDGDDVRLGDVWSERPAVLVWLRHYGWTFCRQHAVQLHRDRDKFEAAGVRLVVIGQGKPEHAIHFRDSHDIELEILVDGGRESYRAAGTKVATVTELLGPRVVAKGTTEAIKQRLPQQRTQGHPAQLGGVMIVMPDGSVPYTHLSDDAGDNAPNEEVLAAARSAVAGASS